MSEIPEEAQARALRAVADAAKKRDLLYAQAQEVVAAAAVEADRLGASRTRIREEAGVSPRTLYGWLTAAGLPVRPKKSAKSAIRRGAPPPGESPSDAPSA